MAAWPSTVNLNALQASYREKPERWNVASFSADVGPPTERVRASGSTDLVDFQLKLTAAEWANLMTFWRTTVHSGVDRFTMANPLSGVTETYKFRDDGIALDSVRSQKYVVSVTLRRFN